MNYLFFKLSFFLYLLRNFKTKISEFTNLKFENKDYGWIFDPPRTNLAIYKHNCTDFDVFGYLSPNSKVEKIFSFPGNSSHYRLIAQIFIIDYDDCTDDTYLSLKMNNLLLFNNTKRNFLLSAKKNICGQPTLFDINSFRTITVFYWNHPSRIIIQLNVTSKSLTGSSNCFFGFRDLYITPHNCSNNNCKYCFKSSDNCTECQNNKLLHKGDCVDNCPVYYVKNNDECIIKCDNSCKTCNGIGVSDCLTCPNSKYLLNGKCVDCLNGYYFNNITCLKCDISCKDCNGGSPENCTSCNSDKFFYHNKCLDKCPLGFFGDIFGKCLECHKSCKECKGINSNQCLSCKKGEIFLNGYCIECPIRTFEENGSCKNCHHSCKSCVGPHEENCTSCFDNMVFCNKTCRNNCFYVETKYFNITNPISFKLIFNLQIDSFLNNLVNFPRKFSKLSIENLNEEDFDYLFLRKSTNLKIIFLLINFEKSVLNNPKLNLTLIKDQNDKELILSNNFFSTFLNDYRKCEEFHKFNQSNFF